MSITLHDLDFLTSDRGLGLLEDLKHQDLSENNTLRLLTQLRKTYSPEESATALTMARLRLKAQAKFGDWADQLFFSPDALEQASDPAIRVYRANSVVSDTIVDMCCGIGSDSLAFAQSGKKVLGVDLDPVRIELARYNAAVLGIDAEFVVSDVREGVPDGYKMAFFDPARRTESGQRLYDVEQYQPPLSIIHEWQTEQILVKLSPGVRLEQLEPYNGWVEFISVGGDLKEAVLHIGDGVEDLQATLLSNGQAYHWKREFEPEVSIGEPQSWLVEPDPALIRAGLVQDAAAAWGGELLDETIAYFTTAEEPITPWARAWEIWDWMPFNLKKLRYYLKAQGVGKLTVKKRGFPMLPEELIAKLKLKKGKESRTLVCTRYQGEPIVMICRDIRAN